MFQNSPFYTTDNLKAKVTNNHSTTESSVNSLKTKVDGIDLIKYVKKTDYNTKFGNLELKIPDVSGLSPTDTFNSKVSQLETKIKTAESKPSISNLATKTEVTNIENKIPDANAFVKKQTMQQKQVASKMIMSLMLL